MSKREHPYQDLPEQAFWKRSVSNRHYAELEALWAGMPLKKADAIATAGSCFAQHIGSNLQRRGANFLDIEPAPAFLGDGEARRWGFGVFSCRYGNIYTTCQLVQLFDEAYGSRTTADDVWESNGRYFDALRPAIDPVGQDSPEKIRDLRKGHLAQVRKMFETLDLFVMTMGLTEAWASTNDGTVYPTAPGTIAGTYNKDDYAFVNFGYRDVYADLEEFWGKLKQVNPGARMLLTVSPVPLQATASEDHVLVATTYSKSTLRAVAGDFATSTEGVFYFPSYEIITSAPGRGMYYDPDWRNVNQYGVDYVMTHFFSGLTGGEFGPPGAAAGVEDLDVVCDEEAMFNTIDA